MENIKTTSAFMTIVGRPNVGKSSFMNAVLGCKVAIVSEKPQTTRTRIMGVYNKDEAQLVYIDTPGFHKPGTELGKIMMKAVNSGLTEVDGVTMIVDAAPGFKYDYDNPPAAELALIKEIGQKKLKAVLGINKIDLLVKKDELLKIIMMYSRLYDFEAVVPFSAKTGDNIDVLVQEQLKFCKPSVHYFPPDEITDQPERVMAAEIIREKLLRLLSKEVPHGIAIDVEKFVENDTKDGPMVNIEAVIYCEKDSHKGIIIGKSGSMLKRVGSYARQDLEDFFGIQCCVKLWVKVKENWRNRAGLIHSFGLD